MLLYRPVGIEELLLMFATGMRAFPPRLPEQPIFYPVLNEEYAAQIARDWNTKLDARAGYVTRFAIRDDYAARFAVQTVGARGHQELWIPAEQLPVMNAAIDGAIEVIDAFFGDTFAGHVPAVGGLAGKDAAAQLRSLRDRLDAGDDALREELAANLGDIYVHVPFWRSRSFAASGVADDERAGLLDAIARLWREVAAALPLPG
jgi:hypothetical protein